jgi:hypothetical protein
MSFRDEALETLENTLSVFRSLAAAKRETAETALEAADMLEFAFKQMVEHFIETYSDPEAVEYGMELLTTIIMFSHSAGLAKLGGAYEKLEEAERIVAKVTHQARSTLGGKKSAKVREPKWHDMAEELEREVLREGVARTPPAIGKEVHRRLKLADPRNDLKIPKDDDTVTRWLRTRKKKKRG